MNRIFETQRLTVRHLVDTDLDLFHEMQANENVMRFTSGSANSLEQNTDQLKSCIQKYEEPGNLFRVWAVERTTDNIFVGTCAIIRNEQGQNEIGYRFRESEWGNGYGKEITNALIDYCIEQLDLDSIVAFVDQNNIASVKILDASLLTEVIGGDCSKCDCDRMYRWERTNS